MWNSLCNYIYNKLFPKSTAGHKRKNEDWSEYPPVKQMKLDTRRKFENTSYEFINEMKKQNLFEDDECCLTKEVFRKKWGDSSTMARQSIHSSKYNLYCSAPLDESKLESNSKSHVLKRTDLCQPTNMSEIEVVKYITKNTVQSSSKVLKSKTASNRAFQSCQPSNSRPNLEKAARGTGILQNNSKKSLNFLQESFRLSEKVQYMQLLQQQTTKLNSLLAPFTIQRVGFKKENRSIPVIDLTKEKNNVIIDRSRENIPWTSSWTKSNDNVNLKSESKDVPKINSLQDLLKTHPVTDKHIIDEILSRHLSETAEKRRQAEIEAAKVEVLNASNRKSYYHALEEKMRNYMRITAPVLEEIEPEKEKYVLPELTKEQESRVSSVFSPLPAGEVIVEKFGLQIKRRDFQTLKGLNWLNDEVINFYMNLIMERGKQDNLPSVYAFNTFFYPKLISGGHASLKRWTKKVDIFSHDMILVPVHLGMHWCMAVIDFRSKEVRYYDSMGSPNSRCLQALLSYLEAESLDKKKVPYNTKDWEQINVDDIPQQMNGSDCGVFSCMFAEHLARDCPLLFSQDHMPYFRKKMTYEIVQSKLLT